jgi:hypothetical protein
MAKATANKPKRKAVRSKAVKAEGNGAAKPAVVTQPKANGEKEKAEPQVCKTCGRPFVNQERSESAKRAWDTIRANREAGFKTSADRLAAAKAEEASKKEAPKAKAPKAKANGKAANKQAKTKKAVKA